MERVLLARTPDRWNKWEKRADRYFGIDDQATFINWLILYGSGIIAILVIVMCSPRIGLQAWTGFFVDVIEHPLRAKTVFFVVKALAMIWAFFGMRYLSAASASANALRPLRMIANAILMLLAQGLLISLLVTQMAMRTPTTLEIAQSLGITVLLLGAGIFVGRAVAALRRPYDEWLTLDLTT